jgi:hypothetical protein
MPTKKTRKPTIPWREKPFVPLDEASEIVPGSVSTLYALFKKQQLEAVQMPNGRTGVTVASIKRLHKKLIRGVAAQSANLVKGPEARRKILPGKVIAKYGSPDPEAGSNNPQKAA